MAEPHPSHPTPFRIATRHSRNTRKNNMTDATSARALIPGNVAVMKLRKLFRMLRRKMKNQLHTKIEAPQPHCEVHRELARSHLSPTTACRHSWTVQRNGVPFSDHGLPTPSRPRSEKASDTSRPRSEKFIANLSPTTACRHPVPIYALHVIVASDSVQRDRAFHRGEDVVL